jgi:YidC/Oxa1 family membrane protein insertase
MRKQQEEIMALQQSEGYSPLSGCLPLLIQMPIIIFLWQVIRGPLTYMAKFSKTQIEACHRVINNLASDATIDKAIDEINLAGLIDGSVIASANGMLGDADQITAELLERIPNMHLFGFNLGNNPALQGFSWASLIILLPFIAAGLQWFSMWISKKLGNNPQMQAGGDAQSKFSMLLLELMGPGMTLFFTFTFPAVLGIYWIYQSIFTILQTLIISKFMPIPKYTEEELKELRKAQKEAEKARQEIIKSQPKYKSLHYIDDDDYEELKELDNKPQDKKSNLSDKPEIKD